MAAVFVIKISQILAIFKNAFQTVLCFQILKENLKVNDIYQQTDNFASKLAQNTKK